MLPLALTLSPPSPSQVLEPDAAQHLLGSLLPDMVQLALRASELCTKVTSPSSLNTSPTGHPLALVLAVYYTPTPLTHRGKGADMIVGKGRGGKERRGRDGWLVTVSTSDGPRCYRSSCALLRPRKRKWCVGVCV